MSGPDPRSFGALLRQHRLIAGLSQEALAERTGLSIDAIRALERGRRTAPRAETLSLLMPALDLSQAERSSLIAAIGTSDSAPTKSLHRPTPSMRSARGLPHPPGPLIGREREMASAGCLLRENDGRLLTLLGAGGVGKTRLALELLHHHADAFDDGAAFVDLAPIRDPALVPAAIADALGLREIGQQDLWSSLLTYLEDRRMLLALDNFEQIIDAAPLIGDLLGACPHVSLLVTSRVALHLRAEQRFPVQPLATQAMPASDSIDVGFVEIPAVRLFAMRAKAVQPDFDLDAKNIETVTAICKGLDGLPLAIELAAARVAYLPPADLLKRLIRRLPVLIDGARDLPERQRTLRATIDWSYELLTVEERTLFRRLSVFAGGCTLEAVTEICHGPEPQEVETIRVLSSLVDNSLVHQSHGACGQTRFFTLEMVREYALELLEESDEVMAVRLRHAAYYLALAESAESSLRSPQQAPSLEQLEREHDNLRAALTFDLKAGPAAGLRLAASLWQFWWTRGHLSEGREWLERLLPATGVSPGIRSRGLLGAGCLAVQQSDWHAARIHLEAGLALSRTLADDQTTAWFLRELGSLLSFTSNHRQAQPLLEEALAISRRLDDAAGLEAALLDLTRILRSRGEYPSARTLLHEALDVALARNSSRSIAAVRVVLGDIARYEANLPEAAAEYTAGLTAAREAGHMSYEAWALGGLGQVALWRGEIATATELLERALGMYRELGNMRSIGFSLHALGLAAWRARDEIRTSELVKEALSLRWRLGGRADIADSLELLALVAAKWDLSRQAVRLFAGANAARIAVETVQPPIEQVLIRESVHSLRVAIGEVRFRELWSEGQKLSLESVVHEALELVVKDSLASER